MALRRLVEELNAKYDADNSTAKDILDFIDTFVEDEQKTYKKNKDNRALMFGKWKGFTIKELSVSDKGRSYVEWLLTQQWFEESKYPDLFEDIKACNIKKKNFRRAVLE